MAYVANYETGNRPYICKVLTANSGEEFHIALNFSNETERSEMSSETIVEHMQNCITYIQDKAKDMSIIPLGEPIGLEPWPAKGWADLEWANNEISLWFNYAYYRDDDSLPEAGPIEMNFTIDAGPAIDLEDGSPHVHDGTEDHTHDAETGEEAPNA